METEKIESRLAELQSDFDFLEAGIKDLQKEIADRQRRISDAKLTQVQISGAFQELKKFK